jgi:polyisoprenoid-binding protein YceI
VLDSPLWFRATRGHAFAELLLATVASLAGAVGQAQPTEADGQPDRYVLAPPRSSLTLDVDIFSHSRIRMRFHSMNAQLEGTRAGLDSGRVMVTIDAASVEARPRFLSPIIRGSGMLDVARYPEIRFVSTRFVRNGEGSGWLVGNLTVHGITRPVTLLVTPGGVIENPRRDGTLAFSATGEVSRREFGLTAWFPTVGDAVHMDIQVEFVHVP